MARVNGNLKAEIFYQFKVDEADLKKLCRKMGVKSLAVFGLVARSEFKVGQSDIDFLVEFEAISTDRFFDFLDFLDGLRELFHYDNVDLVTITSLKNQVIRQAILASQENIYAA